MPPGPPKNLKLKDKSVDLKSSMKKLISYIGKDKSRVIACFVFAIVSTVVSLLGPKILMKATDELQIGVAAMVAGTGGINFGAIWKVLVFLTGVYVFASIIRFFQGYIMADVATAVTRRIRKETDDKLHSLPISYFDKVTHGEVMSIMTNDTDTIMQSLSQGLTQLLTSVVTIAVIIIMMFTISWQMALVAVLVVPLSFLCVSFVFKKSQKHFYKQQEVLGHVNGQIEEVFSSHLVVRAFNGENKEKAKFNKLNNELRGSAWKAGFLSGVMWPITHIIGNLGYVGVCIVGGYLVINNGVRVSVIQAFVQYVKQMNSPLMEIANISNSLQQLAAASERVFGFLAQEDEMPDKNPATELPENHFVDFENVHFGYSKERTVINAFSANIKEGNKIAIVGPTGAGKTTIVKLLMRFYDVNSGTIKIGGINIKDFKRADLRSMLGMVLQDTWLFNGTIIDNIRYGKLGASDIDVMKAAAAAQVDKFVHNLPKGYNMMLNEEADNVSAGQKQLLTIARTILSDPKILILDEATSNVDTSTEVLIQKAMDNLMKGRTSFVIAHRLSTIKNADLILVMDNGDIVEQGTHEELLNKKGFYAELYNSQFAETA